MRQLSFAFLRSGQHTTELPTSVAAPAQPVTLRRIDPAKNMARFYSMEVERDLLGRVVLVRRWGGPGNSPSQAPRARDPTPRCQTTC